jgi:hypothetical protein
VYEEIKPTMVEELDPDVTLLDADVQSGDIFILHPVPRGRRPTKLAWGTIVTPATVGELTALSVVSGSTVGE